MNKRVTLADVAERAGFSKTAASQVLNDRPGVRLSTEAVTRIRTAADELGYRPNPAARSLRLGRTGTFGFLSDEVTITRFASAMIRGLVDVAEQHDHAVLIGETGAHHAQPAKAQAQLQRALASMLDRRVDGLIVGAVQARRITLPELPADLPVVTVNCTSPEAGVAVLPDEYEAGRAVATALLEHGHREGIGILGHSPVSIRDPLISVTIGRRFAGLSSVFAEAGVEPVVVQEFQEWEPWHGFDAMADVLDRGVPVTAMVCLNDRVALGAQQAIAAAGRSVPEDISLVSFDDDEIASYLRPALTTARLPYEEMGRRAMELLVDPDRPRDGEVLVPMPLQARDSVAAPAAAPAAVRGGTRRPAPRRGR